MTLPRVEVVGSIIRVPSHPRSRRALIRVEGVDIPLWPRQFRLIAILAFARYHPYHRRHGGWVRRSEFTQYAQGFYNEVWRARTQVQRYLPSPLNTWPVLENRHNYMLYRLATGPDKIQFPDPVEIARFGDATVTAWLNKYLRPREDALGEW